MPADFLQHLRQVLSLVRLAIMPGGRYLNLSDLLNFPVFDSHGHFLMKRCPVLKKIQGQYSGTDKKDMLFVSLSLLRAGN